MSHTYPGGIGHCDRFRELVTLFENEEQRNYYYTRAQDTVEREFGDCWYRSDELVFGGLMLLLYAWNFAAPQTKKMDAEEIKDLLEAHHAEIEEVRDTQLIDADLDEGGVVFETVREVFPPFKDYFGQTGASKVLSLLSPQLFVMWDQDIRTRNATTRGGSSEGQREDRGVYFYLKEAGHEPYNTKPGFGRQYKDYIAFLRYCQEIMEDTRDCPFIREKEEPLAKLLDEALYAYYKIEKG